MKIVEYPKRNKVRTIRRDRPDEPVMYVNLGLTESIFRQIEASAKANFRTASAEVRFRLARDLDKNP